MTAAGWALWARKPHAAPTCDVTAESFSELFAELDLAHLPVGSDVHIFRAGVAPQFNDPVNRTGGHLRFRASDMQSAACQWQLIAAGLVCASFPDPKGVILGLTVVHKATYASLGLWLADFSAHLCRKYTKALRNYLRNPTISVRAIAHGALLAAMKPAESKTHQEPHSDIATPAPPLPLPGIANNPRRVRFSIPWASKVEPRSPAIADCERLPSLL
eukprot:TRINITY_DN41154_c0_g1_i1.p1 TRINITY_DN41154_c0_g1~~TRINITY_DN41154_c0_g1_i1.p1  ORF type:complete len:224 (-),score=6.54 TRINITY_DN41154_c0_g1_i1:239-889(-)